MGREGRNGREGNVVTVVAVVAVVAVVTDARRPSMEAGCLNKWMSYNILFPVVFLGSIYGWCHPKFLEHLVYQKSTCAVSGFSPKLPLPRLLSRQSQQALLAVQS